MASCVHVDLTKNIFGSEHLTYVVTLMSIYIAIILKNVIASDFANHKSSLANSSLQSKCNLKRDYVY